MKFISIYKFIKFTKTQLSDRSTLDDFIKSERSTFVINKVMINIFEFVAQYVRDKMGTLYAINVHSTYYIDLFPYFDRYYVNKLQTKHQWVRFDRTEMSKVPITQAAIVAAIRMGNLFALMNKT